MKRRSCFQTWLGLIFSVPLVGGDCNAPKAELHVCFQSVQNVFLTPSFIFPASQKEVDQSCSQTFPKMWSDFVSCVTNFTEACEMSNPEKTQIHQAVGKSINSIHKICTNKAMQADYRNVSACLRQKISANSECEAPYQKFIQDANQGYESLCCSHNDFKDCLLDESKPCCSNEECGDLVFSADLAKSWLEQAFGFVFKQCEDLSYCEPSTTEEASKVEKTTQSYAYYPVSSSETSTLKETIVTTIIGPEEPDEPTTTPPGSPVLLSATTSATLDEELGGMGTIWPKTRSTTTENNNNNINFNWQPPQEPRSLDERLNLLSHVTAVPRSSSSSDGPNLVNPSQAGSLCLIPPLLLCLLGQLWR
eukprot:maker-scaffold22_size673200-snap-gene-4.18 protein:Tk12688 transcript:maker-scaffold22_size673200-snap-gene-4.18-mRNA-1 annotation:"PREDICTED: uncharacterized protein LOC100570485"